MIPLPLPDPPQCDALTAMLFYVATHHPDELPPPLCDEVDELERTLLGGDVGIPFEDVGGWDG